MSYQTIAIIMIISSSLILTLTALSYRRLYKNEEAESVLKERKALSAVLIILFWASLLIGGILLLQEKISSISVLYISTYLMFGILVVQLGYSLIYLFQVRSIKDIDGKILRGLALKEVMLKLIQFVITSVMMIWFQNWLDTITF